MPTKNEQIMVALLAALQATPGVVIERNMALPELPGDGYFCRLGDGPIVPGDEFLNPPVFEFTMTPTILIVVSGGTDEATRDAAVEAKRAALLATIDTITDLGDLITAIRPQPPSYAPRELWGAADMKGAELGIEIDYWSDTSAG
jgi:hypothetical protein